MRVKNEHDNHTMQIFKDNLTNPLAFPDNTTEPTNETFPFDTNIFNSTDSELLIASENNSFNDSVRNFIRLVLNLENNNYSDCFYFL